MYNVYEIDIIYFKLKKLIIHIYIYIYIYIIILLYFGTIRIIIVYSFFLNVLSQKLQLYIKNINVNAVKNEVFEKLHLKKRVNLKYIKTYNFMNLSVINNILY